MLKNKASGSSGVKRAGSVPMNATGGRGQSCMGTSREVGMAVAWEFEVQSGVFPCKLQTIRLAGLSPDLCRHHLGTVHI